MSNDRTVRSFNISDELAEWLDSRENVNASGVVRDLLREYVTLGKAPEAALSVRIAEIEADIKDRHEKITRLQQEIKEFERKRDDIRDRIRHRQRQYEDTVVGLADMVRNGQVPEEQIHPESDVIAAKASDVGITTTQLTERVQAELSGDSA